MAKETKPKKKTTNDEATPDELSQPQDDSAVREAMADQIAAAREAAKMEAMLGTSAAGASPPVIPQSDPEPVDEIDPDLPLEDQVEILKKKLTESRKREVNGRKIGPFWVERRPRAVEYKDTIIQRPNGEREVRKVRITRH